MLEAPCFCSTLYFACILGSLRLTRCGKRETIRLLRIRWEVQSYISSQARVRAEVITLSIAGDSQYCLGSSGTFARICHLLFQEHSLEFVICY